MPEIVNTSQLSTESDENDNREVMIKVDHVSMMFNIASAQLNSLKEYAIALARRELSFKEFWALDDICFEVRKGDVYGIMGTNGSGKSTTLKIIAGVLEPTRGHCEINGNIAPLIELGAGFDMELTARENIYLNGALLGYSRKFINQHFDEIVEFSEVKTFLDMPMKNYSSGMVARIAFAIATVIVPDILIVDEVLSVGDFMFQQKCERRIQELIRDYGVTVLIVSHSNKQVSRLCNKAIWIEKGHTRMIGSAEEVCKIYEMVGGREGSRESEQMILDTIDDTEVDISEIDCVTISGDTKYGTAVKLAEPQLGHFDRVIITPGEGYAESIMATALASRMNAKLLTCDYEKIPDLTYQALEQLSPNEVYFVSRSQNNFAQTLAPQLPGSPRVETIQGDDNMKLGLALYEKGKEYGGWGDTCIITPEFALGDQFSMLPAACELSAPVFFNSSRERLDQALIDEVLAHFKRVLVLAGRSAISDEKLQVFKDAGIEVLRFLAEHEFEANIIIMNWMKEERAKAGLAPIDRLVILDPHHPDDSYCAGSYAERHHAWILLSDPNNLDHEAEAIRMIQSFNGAIQTLDFIGDPSIFSDLDKTVMCRVAAKARLHAENEEEHQEI